MTGKTIGYVRISTIDQNTARQLVDVQCDRIFEDKVSGKNTDRPALQEMLAYVRDGDKIVVHSMDRLARNLDDLRRIVFDLVGRGITIEFKKESMTYAPGEANPMSTLLLSVMGAFAEFERALIRERQREGITIARQLKAWKGSERVLNDAQVRQLIDRIENGEALSRVAKDIGFLGLKFATGKPRVTLSRSTMVLERDAYVNKYPEIVKIYPRLKKFLKQKETAA